MAQKSSIDRLPKEIKEAIDTLLKGDRHTYDEILDKLNELHEDADISRSALGRYAKRTANYRREKKRTNDVIEIMSKNMGEVAESKLGRVVVELLQSAILDLMLARYDEDGEPVPVDPKTLAQLSQASKNLQYAMKISVDQEMKIREDERRQAKEEAVKAVEKTAREKGLTKDTVEAIKAGILGV